MSVATTLYVHEATLGLIAEACAMTGTTRSRLIATLLERSMRDPGMEPRIGRLVRYQRADRREAWRTVHVRFREDEVDYVKDLRSFYRVSASLLLAVAARRFIREIIRQSEKREQSDNYPFSNYLLSRETIDGYIFWKICWGFPPNPEKYITIDPAPLE